MPGRSLAIDALLLIGPTGSGKTPLGEALEFGGWNGRRCRHFDFGARLREAEADAGAVPALSEGEREVVRAVLRDGVLLEDGRFSIARKILEKFIERIQTEPGDLLVLNGLPRHVGQARDIESIAAVVGLVVLTASPQTIRERIARDTAGDRAGRGDDTPEDIGRKLSLYEERTRPLVDYYAAKGIPVIRLEVGPRTSAAGLLEALGSGKPA